MEQALLNVAQIFTGEINKLESRKAGSGAKIRLKVEMGGYGENKKTKVELICDFYDGSEYHSVKAASLGALMGEVYRRAGFADREALRLDQVEAQLQTLPAPSQV